MAKGDISSDNKNLINLALGRQSNKQNSRLADITLDEMNNENKKKKMLKDLSSWNADVDNLKKKANIK